MRRKSLDAALADVTQWPQLCTAGMAPERAQFAERRMLAIRLYLAGESHAKIKVKTGLDRRRVCELMDRAIMTHLDGRIFGFRICKYHSRPKPYRRTAPSPALREHASFGHAGLLERLFDRYPDIREAVLAKALKSGTTEFAESALRYDKMHAFFIEECRRAKIPGNEYPFNVENQGARGLARFLKKELANRSLRKLVNSSFGDEAARKLGHSWAPMRTGEKQQCLQRVEFDGHRIDAMAVIELIDPAGGLPVFLPIERLWVLVVIDTASRAVLGYHVCFGRHYSSEDVLACFENALLPWKPRALSIPGLRYSPVGGMPSGAIPALAYAKWGELAIDNDKSNCAKWVWDRVRTVLGCVINPGPVRTPDRRQFIERFFRYLEQNGFQRLPVTTGSSPVDPKRREPEEMALRYKVKLDELLDLVDVMIADYNGLTTTALYNRSPLDYLRFAVEQKSFFIRQIPEADRPNLILTLKRTPITVRGNLKTGVRPYLRFEGVRYYSVKLSNSPDLIGKQIIAQCDTRDLRTLRVFLLNGEEFDTVTVTESWAYHAHDLRMRKAILRCIRLGQIARRDASDPLADFMKLKAAEALSAKKPRNELAHALRVKKREPKPGLTLKPPTAVPIRISRPKAPVINLSGRTLNY